MLINWVLSCLTLPLFESSFYLSLMISTLKLNAHRLMAATLAIHRLLLSLSVTSICVKFHGTSSWTHPGIGSMAVQFLGRFIEPMDGSWFLAIFRNQFLVDGSWFYGGNRPSGPWSSLLEINHPWLTISITYIRIDYPTGIIWDTTTRVAEHLGPLQQWLLSLVIFQRVCPLNSTNWNSLNYAQRDRSA